MQQSMCILHSTYSVAFCNSQPLTTFSEVARLLEGYKFFLWFHLLRWRACALPVKSELLSLCVLHGSGHRHRANKTTDQVSYQDGHSVLANYRLPRYFPVLACTDDGDTKIFVLEQGRQLRLRSSRLMAARACVQQAIQ